jgi:hypothetical protein
MQKKGNHYYFINLQRIKRQKIVHLLAEMLKALLSSKELEILSIITMASIFFKLHKPIYKKGWEIL